MSVRLAPKAKFQELWSARSLKMSERIELMRLVTGTKSLVRLVAEERTYQALRNLIGSLGFSCTISTVKQAQITMSSGDIYTRTVEWNDPAGVCFSIFVSTDTDLIEEAITLEADNSGDSNNNNVRMANLLGYPQCCVEHYNLNQDSIDWLRSILNTHTEGLPVQAAANPLARYFTGHSLIPDFFPCSLSCSGTQQLSVYSIEALLFFEMKEKYEEILSALIKPVFQLGEDAICQYVSNASCKTSSRTQLAYWGNVKKDRFSYWSKEVNKQNFDGINHPVIKKIVFSL